MPLNGRERRLEHHHPSAPLSAPEMAQEASNQGIEADSPLASNQRHQRRLRATERFGTKGKGWYPASVRRAMGVAVGGEAVRVTWCIHRRRGHCRSR